MFLHQLQKRKLINPPLWLCDNTHYLTIMGSHSYGVADTHISSNLPDYDYYGFCIPPKHIVFPHLAGEIKGFGTHKEGFDQFITPEQGVEDTDARKKYDIQVFNIVKYFELCRGNNPNMIDSLFTPLECITHVTAIGQLVRDNRKLFLSKNVYHRFRGYAYAQFKKIENKNPTGKRKEIVEKHGYDVKFAYHIVRLLDECEQMLVTEDLDLRRSKEVMKAVRRGEWTLDQIQEWMVKKDLSLQDNYNKTKLPHSPSEVKLKELLLNCLEQHYGNLKDAYVEQDKFLNALRDIDLVLEKHRSVMYQ